MGNNINQNLSPKGIKMEIKELLRAGRNIKSKNQDKIIANPTEKKFGELGSLKLKSLPKEIQDRVKEMTRNERRAFYKNNKIPKFSDLTKGSK
jgi:hypothetical protein